MRALLAAACACAVALSGCSGSDDPPASSEPDDDGVEITELDAGPVGVADVGGEAWTVLADAGTVRTGDDRRIEVGDAPLRIVDTPAGPWVSVIRDGTVVRIDPASGEVAQTVRLRPRGSEPEGLAWDGESLWVVDQAGSRVVELDRSGVEVASYRTDDEPRLVAAGDSGVWVANFGASSISRVADGNVTTAPAGCVGPQGIAEAQGLVWVACTLSNKVVALDPQSMEHVHEIDLPYADAITTDGTTVYAVGQTGPTVLAIDAASGDVRDTVTLDKANPTGENVGAAVVGDDLVVTHPDVRRVYTLPLP